MAAGYQQCAVNLVATQSDSFKVQRHSLVVVMPLPCGEVIWECRRGLVLLADGICCI